MSTLLKEKLSSLYEEKRLRNISCEKLKLLDEVIKGIGNDEFKIFIQPQVDIKTQKILCGEALVRWIKDDGTMIMPDDFFPLLEETRLVYLFDCYMLDKVCQQIKKWIDKGIEVKPIAVNQSAMNLDNENYFENFIEIVDKYEVPHSHIAFELTETVFVEKGELIQKFVRKLSDAGFSLAIDDFGTGYSNLNILTEVQADVLKIDRSVIRGICINERSKIIVGKIIEMSHEMGMIVVSEGVETVEQLELLKELNCDIAQGFYFSKAVDVETFEQLCNGTEQFASNKLSFCKNSRFINR